MILKSCMNNMIYNEFSEDNRDNFFDIRDRKFLNTIDSLYYSVLLDGDFSYESKDERVVNYRYFWNEKLAGLRIYNEPSFTSISGLPFYFTLKYFSYGSGTYEVCLSRADCYDIFFAKKVASPETPQVLVQLRSKALWMDGVRKTVDDSLKDVEIICKYFGFNFVDVKENRCDYCWHTNYLQNPEVYFNPERFAKIRLSKMSDSMIHVKYFGNEDYLIDYVTLGKKSSKNVFFRIYNKSKEVVEKGYKAFFLKLWQLNGLISRYDLYCYEYAYEFRNWDYVNIARCKFYLHYGSDSAIKFQCKQIVEGHIKLKYDDLKSFADMITPPVTLILNIEYQTMRKFSSSLMLPNSIFNNKKYGVRSRLYDYIDNYRFIANYLTEHSVRLVAPEGDINKSRREDLPFWSALRRSRAIDGKNNCSDAVALRQYDHDKNSELVKKRALSSICSFNLYYKGENTESSEIDILDFMNSLNDNDIENMQRLKNKKLKRADYREALGRSNMAKGRFALIDVESGEIIKGGDLID